MRVMWIFASMYGGCAFIGYGLLRFILKRQKAWRDECAERDKWNADLDAWFAEVRGE